VEVLEGVEELLLEALLVLDELHVVDEQDVAVAVAALEGAHGVGADGVDEVVQERLGRHVAHVHGRVVLVHVVGDGVEQVGLPQPRVAVDEERVERPGGFLGDAHGGGQGEAVRGAADEGLERVLRVG
jgi:hypothetical protein